MRDEEPEPTLVEAPSFRDPPSAVHLDSPQRIPAVHRQIADPDDDSDSDFEFAFVVRDPDAYPAITADEIFSDGRIRPFYPVFDRALLLSDDPPPESKPGRMPLRRLLIEDREVAYSASSEADELEGLAPGTYCVWTPSQDRGRKCKKSGSTGSSRPSRRWRLRDLIGRSHSDGKEKFVFLATDEKKNKNGEKKKAVAAEQNKKGGKVTDG